MSALSTNRLILRPYADSDFDGVHAYGSDPDVARYMLWGPNNVEDTREFLRTVHKGAAEEPRTKYDFAITLREDGHVNGHIIGGCGIYLRGPQRMVGELGYVLNPKFHRQGLMPEAVMRLMEFGFEDLKLHRVFARCHPANRPSAWVMEKAGMLYEGRLREAEMVKGEWWDFLFYSRLVHEWRARSESPLPQRA